jgi:hypothetical protein
MAGEQIGLSPEEQSALEATEAWVARPNSTSGEEAASATAELSVDSPAYWAANAAAFAEVVEGPEEASVPETGGDLTSHFSASTVLLSAAKMSSEDISELSDTPAETVTADGFPIENPGAENIEQLSDLTPAQQMQAAQLLEPFIELGLKLARTVRY